MGIGALESIDTETTNGFALFPLGHLYWAVDGDGKDKKAIPPALVGANKLHEHRRIHVYPGTVVAKGRMRRPVRINVLACYVRSKRGQVLYRSKRERIFVFQMVS